MQTAKVHAMVKPHPKWDPESYARDIMLFRLKTAVTFTGYRKVLTKKCLSYF